MPDLFSLAVLLDPTFDLARSYPARAEAWGSQGLTRFDVLVRLARGWCAYLPPDIVIEQLVPGFVDHLLAAPDPDLALLTFARIQEDQGSLSLARASVDDPRFGHDLLFLLGLGHYSADALRREPGLSDLLLEPDLLAQPMDPAALRQDAVATVRRFTTPQSRRNALRSWKRGQFVRIIIRDWLLHHSQQVITAEISAVADACVEAALHAAAREVLGAETLPRGLAIMAMGKWGSAELNYNSDIDLICVATPADGLGLADWERVVQLVGQELSEATAEGHIFRVDHRLRPEGEGSTLVRSLESCVAYYADHAQAWEALALTRVRAAAGDPDIGRAFEQLAQRVAFGARMRQAGIESLRANRRALEHRSAAVRNVKEGPGGIRDIEFSTQLLTLVRGVTDPSVRERNTWTALRALRRAGAISYAEEQQLGESYDFLRRVEHLLQLQPIAPITVLPDEPAALRRLARAMGYRAGRAGTAGQRFLSTYSSHTERTREQCNRLFYNPIPLSSPDAGSRIADLLDPALADAEATVHLAEIDFADPVAARRRLLFLAHGEPPMRLPESVQAKFVEFLPTLLTCVQRMPDPDAALRWFERMVSRAGGRELAYQLFLDHPTVIEVMCRVGGYSHYLSQTLVEHPEYLDSMVLASYSQFEPSLDDLRQELEARLAPLRTTEQRLDDLRRFRRREMFRLGVRDLLGMMDVSAVVSGLADVAEACLRALVAELAATVPGAAELPFAVIGVGKLGGRALHYSSDLDVLFVYEDVPGLDSGAVAQRLAQRITRASEELTRAGRLAPLDARLRPYGTSGALTRTIASYSAYWAASGEPWERLPLTRCRPVAGDLDLGRRFVAAAEEFAYGPPPTAAEFDSLRDMKRRIETERLDTLDQTQLDFKLEPGGILDIEYLTQVLQIEAGDQLPELRGLNTPSALGALVEVSLLTPSEGELLLRNYWLLRRTELRLQLVSEDTGGALPLEPAALTAAAKRLGWNPREADRHPQQLVADLRLRLAAVREVVARHLRLS